MENPMNQTKTSQKESPGDKPSRRKIRDRGES